MKAEHRKELQTNTLADGMGRLVQRMKTKPTGGSVWVWLLAVTLIVVVVVGVYWQNSRKDTNSDLWVQFDQMNDSYLKNFVTNYPTTNQGYSARMQYAWIQLWDFGIKFLAANPKGATQGLQSAQTEYRQLADELRGNFPTLAAEAMYCAAVAQEALTVEDPANLDKALAEYKKVVNDYPATAHGKQAQARVAFLENEQNRGRVERFYAELRQGVLGRGFHDRPAPTQEDIERMLQQLKEQQSKKK